MATNETNGISLRRLKTFLTNLKNIFAEKKHSHATSDITGLNTALSSKATLAQGNKADSAVQSVKIGTTEYKSGTTVTLPSYPTSLPASDVSDWAKAKTKPSYSASEVGLGNVGNFKAVSTVQSQGLTDTEKTNARANIGAQVAGSYASSTHNHDDKYQAKGNYASALHTHTKSQITDFPSSLPANGGNASTVNGHTINADVPSGAKFTDTNTWRGIQNNLTSDSTSDSLSAAQGKVLKGLVDSKVTESQNLATDLNNIKSTGIHHISASTSNNPTGTHGTLFVEFNVGTPYQIWLPDNSNTAYKRNYTTSTSTWGIWTQLKFTDTNTVTNIGTTSSNYTNGNILIQGSGATTVSKSGNTVTISSTNTDTNTWRPLGTTADTACAGNDSRLSNARPASDVYSWAKASSKPSYTYSEVGAASANHSHSNYLTGINKTMVVNALDYTPPTTNTTYNVATQSSNGLFSASDKKKLDGITSGSNTVMKLISSTDYSKLSDAQKKNGTVYFVV